MKKFLKSVLMGLTITMLFATPTFAATNSSTYQPIKGDTIVSQGDGYLVVVPKDDKESSTPSRVEVQPMSTTSYTMSQGGSGTYDGSTYNNYADGQLIDYSSISVTNQHNLVGSDYMWAYGRQYVKYSGLNPYNADSYTFAPAETVTASATVQGISIPAGITFTPVGGSSTLNWLAQTINNNFQANYYWNQWQCATTGHFNSVSTNDQVSWRFGTTVIAQVNTVKITLQ